MLKQYSTDRKLGPELVLEVLISEGDNMDSPIVRKIDKMKNSISKRMARERTFSNERKSVNERMVDNFKMFFFNVSSTFWYTLTIGH